MDFDPQPGGIDLHIHTTASDGTYSPFEILDMARKAGLSAISITDHDSIEGVAQIQAGSVPGGLQFIAGVEISTAPPSGSPLKGSLHLLGYGFDPTDPGLNRALNRLQKARAGRNPKILGRLSAVGIDLSPEEVAAEAEGGQAGRPHIARAMVRRGFAASIDDAFDRFLGAGRPAYVDKYRIPVQEAIQTIQGAGGIAVLAHPFLLQPLDADGIAGLLAQLKTIGLDGIEVYYSGHSADQIQTGLELAKRFDLIITGGSDFHGDPGSKVQLGRGTGDLYIPRRIFETIVSALSGHDAPLPAPNLDPHLLEQRLSYRFEDRRLLEEALNHRSFVHEHGGSLLHSNERLEFLGDAVLNLAAGHLLMKRFSEVPEGLLSRTRAHLVNESQVAKLARRIDLGRFIRLGKGELLSGGSQKRSILADAYEAVIGAIYLDGGFEAAFRILRAHLGPLIEDRAEPDEGSDFKSRLQETAQGEAGEVPEYRLVREEGPDHDKRFRMQVCVAGICAEGTGKSKKTAEQNAARKALDRFCRNRSSKPNP